MSKFMQSPLEAPYVAVVGGATGATGRYIVTELLNDPKCTKVVALTRKAIDKATEAFPGSTEEGVSKKLIVSVTDWSEMKSKHTFTPSLPDSPTVAFCAMGSAPYSEESDYTVPVAFAQACKNAGCESMFLVSAANAKANSWIGYSDCIGRREEAMKAMNFKRLGIFRPGMIERHELRRPKEYLGYLLPSAFKIDAKDIAKTMVSAATRMNSGTHLFSHGEMKNFASGKSTLSS